MNIICEISHNEMIAEFLKAELHSSRFKQGSLKALQILKYKINVIDKPDLTNAVENRMREDLLGICRGWPNKELFEKFPTNIKWNKAEVSLDELLHSYRLKSSPEMSEEERSFSRTAGRILKGQHVEKIDNAVIKSIEKKIYQGHKLPPIILVIDKAKEKKVVIEGHSRSVAYCVAGTQKTIPAIIGISPKMHQWIYF